MRRFVVLLSIFVLALVAVPRVSAAPQGKGPATLTGTVLGPDDKPVPHANISYQSSSGSLPPHVVRADSHGNFTITKLHADAYDLRASGRGVFSAWEKNINLHAGQTRSVTLRLIYAKKIPKAYVKSTTQPPQQSQQPQQ
ncbi:MAG TPA: carboxypeptidase-like regulatory domain-containing protein [Candidatus Angelobacter sp.]|nr:carboxypeptidase-like regulatory domain-containing protein [Candidatus Angelobacter sp.]